MRLDKYLSDLKIASRKELKKIIKDGRVLVNGRAAVVPETAVDPEQDEVALDGRPLSYCPFRYFAVDKPCGVLSVTEDRKQRTVLNLLPTEIRALELFPVGRLDKDTSGLLILTNDGDYAHRVISPKYGIKKVYLAGTEETVTESDVKAFETGLVLRDGLHCLPAGLKPISRAEAEKHFTKSTVVFFPHRSKSNRSLFRTPAFKRRLRRIFLTLITAL